MKTKKYKNNKETKGINYYRLAAAVIIFVLVSVSIFYFFIYRNSNEETNVQSTDESSSQINLNPPTQEESESGDRKKEEIVEQSDEEPEKPSTANVIITDASQYDDTIEIRAFVSNVVKDGNCTYTLSQNNDTVTRVSPAYADASSTPCVALNLSRSEIPTSGSWEIEVKYENTDITGIAKSELVIQ